MAKPKIIEDIENLQVEVTNARNGKANLKTKIDEIDTTLTSHTSQLADIVQVYIRNYPRLNGETNDTARINRAIAYLTSIGGGKIILEPNSNYSIDANANTSVNAGIILDNNIEFDGNNSTLNVIGTSSSYYKAIHVQQKNNVKIRNVNIIGERTTHVGSTGEQGYGIHIASSTNVLVKNCNSSNCWGDGIILNTWSGNHIPCQNVTLINCNFDNNRRQGMSVVGCYDLLVEKCTFTNTNGTSPECGVDIEPNSGDPNVQRVTFIKCKFEGNANAGFVVPYSAANDFTFIDCDFNGKPNAGVSKGFALSFLGSNALFIGCRIKGTATVEDSVVQGCNFYIDDNYQANNWTLIATTDKRSIVRDSEFYAYGTKRLINFSGSTKIDTGKEINNCLFSQDGNTSYSTPCTITGYVDMYKCNFINPGLHPSSPYVVSVDNNAIGSTIKVRNCFCDANWAIGYFGNGNITLDGEVSMLKFTSLPTVKSNYRGVLGMLIGGTGVADQLYLCRKNASDTYEWKQITS